MASDQQPNSASRWRLRGLHLCRKAGRLPRVSAESWRCPSCLMTSHSLNLLPSFLHPPAFLHCSRCSLLRAKLIYSLWFLLRCFLCRNVCGCVGRGEENSRWCRRPAVSLFLSMRTNDSNRSRGGFSNLCDVLPFAICSEPKLHPRYKSPAWTCFRLYTVWHSTLIRYVVVNVQSHLSKDSGVFFWFYICRWSLFSKAFSKRRRKEGIPKMPAFRHHQKRRSTRAFIPWGQRSAGLQVQAHTAYLGKKKLIN